MSKWKKLFFRHIDKLVYLVLLLWVIWVAFGAFLDLFAEPEMVTQARDAVHQQPKSAYKDSIQFKFVERYKTAHQWRPSMDKLSRNVFYIYEKVNLNRERERYEKMLKEHEPYMVELIDKKKIDIFPGSDIVEEAPDSMIGPPTDLKAVEKSVTSITIQWKDPTYVNMAKMSHCEIQRRKFEEGMKDEEGWAYLMTEKKRPGDPDIRLQKYPIWTDPDKKEEVKEEDATEESTGGFRMFSSAEDSAGEGAGATAADAEIKEERNPEWKRYVHTDINLDPNTTYQYRVQVVGKRIEGIENAGAPIVGAFSKPIAVKTEKGQGVRFVEYNPGYKFGDRVSPPYVKLKVSKLYSPPWPSPRIFQFYEHKITLAEDENKRVGKVVRRYKITDEEGRSVYVKRVQGSDEFFYIGDRHGTTEEDLKQMQKESAYKSFAIDLDFTTPWLADRVDEEIIEEKTVTQRLENGKLVDVEDVKKKYRYFLVLTNADDSTITTRIELERDNLERRLILR